MERSRTVLALGAVVLMLAGCSSSGRADAAADAALQFHRAVTADDGDAACALLSSEARHEVEESAGAPCAEAILEEDLPAAAAVRESKAYGGTGFVRLDGDIVFTAEFADGWRVIAAGCTPRPEIPYDCTVKGA